MRGGPCVLNDFTHGARAFRWFRIGGRYGRRRWRLERRLRSAARLRLLETLEQRHGDPSTTLARRPLPLGGEASRAIASSIRSPPPARYATGKQTRPISEDRA